MSEMDSDLNNIRKLPEQLRGIHHDLLENGNQLAAIRLVKIADQIDKYLSLISFGNSVTEVDRLRAIIKNAIPYQTNAEVQRWLQAALLYGAVIYQDGGGRRIDA